MVLSLETFIQDFRNFIQYLIDNGTEIKTYKEQKNPLKYLRSKKIGVNLDHHKDIVLQDETKFELGGINKRSFSIIHIFNNSNFVEDGKITLIGREICDLKESNIDFGMFILISGTDFTESIVKEMRQINFISNSIEGFSIRSIPQRFWCRISKNIIKNLSFEFLGNAIMYLYKEKFKNIIESIEILFINSYPKIIKQFINISSSILKADREKWKQKVDEWKKRIDCNYDWGCDICPYQVDCQDVKEVLIEREILDEENKP